MTEESLLREIVYVEKREIAPSFSGTKSFEIIWHFNQTGIWLLYARQLRKFN